MTALPTILVEPAEALVGRRRLFDALAMALDMRFVAGAPGNQPAVAGSSSVRTRRHATFPRSHCQPGRLQVQQRRPR